MTKHITYRVWLLGLLLFLSGTTTYAAVILEGTKATGITGLGIGLPELYDITFEQVTGVPDNPFTLKPCGSSNPCDLFGTTGNEEAANLASIDIAAALNSAGAVTVGPVGGTFSKSNFKVAYNACTDQGSPGFCISTSQYIGSSWLPPLDGFIYEDSADVVFARFTPSINAPLPPAGFLFASGLAVLGWVRRSARMPASIWL